MASEANSSEPSVPPEPVSNASGYPEINPCPTELPYPNRNPCMVGPLGVEFPHHEQALDSLLAHNDDFVTQHWQRCREAAMQEGDLAVIAACPVTHAPKQCQAYRELDYKIVKELRTLVKGSSISSHHILSYLESISTVYILVPNDWKSIMKIISTVMQFAVWLTDYRELCTTQAEVLQDRNPPIIVTQLSGEGPYAVPTVQAGRRHDVYGIITHLALQALGQLPGTGIDSNMLFTKILQGPAE